MRLQAGDSGRIDRSFVHQHNGDAVPHRINAAALGALEALAPVFVFEYQRLFTHGADQNLEQVLGDHGKHSTLRDEPIHHGDTGARKNWGIV